MSAKPPRNAEFLPVNVRAVNNNPRSVSSYTPLKPNIQLLLKTSLSTLPGPLARRARLHRRGEDGRRRAGALKRPRSCPVLRNRRAANESCCRLRPSPSPRQICMLMGRSSRKVRSLCAASRFSRRISGGPRTRSTRPRARTKARLLLLGRRRKNCRAHARSPSCRLSGRERSPI